MDPVLTNELIAMARVCLCRWATYLENVGEATAPAESASEALSALEATTAEWRSMALRVACKPDMKATIITAENLSNILESVDYVIYCLEEVAVPRYLEEVRSFFCNLRHPQEKPTRKLILTLRDDK
jgi:hypothetical protein